MSQALQSAKSTIYRLVGTDDHDYENNEDDARSEDLEKYTIATDRIPFGQVIRSKHFVILIVTLLAFNVLFWIGVLIQSNQSNSATTTERFSADYVPAFQPLTRTFEDTLSFGGPRSRFTDKNWASLIPQGGGFIPFRNPEAYGMPSDTRQSNTDISTILDTDGMPTANATTPSVQFWGVSVFHQLHCLSMLRKIYWNDRKGIPMEREFVDHAAHCFDFLRQALSCYSDTTLEMPQLRTKGEDSAQDGIDRATHSSKRQCRDFESIKRWTEQEYMKAVGEM
ncbi:hypothetical protein NA57DRAFT_72723 [Rhizodiscina lignyota]|uniref:Uncharacterized protein n=1 Tax=Rhizodiscina lignyota TaxID=1504668 RepID=A0A9P4INC1_9PEZI|nr:hypothetical protein NA57DRAFT_72723 [Rhizodiscina lignyota]